MVRTTIGKPIGSPGRWFSIFEFEIWGTGERERGDGEKLTVEMNMKLYRGGGEGVGGWDERRTRALDKLWKCYMATLCINCEINLNGQLEQQQQFTPSKYSISAVPKSKQGNGMETRISSSSSRSSCRPRGEQNQTGRIIVQQHSVRDDSEWKRGENREMVKGWIRCSAKYVHFPFALDPSNE